MNNGSLNPDWWTYFERYPLPKPYPPYQEDSSPESQSEYEIESGDEEEIKKRKQAHRMRQVQEYQDMVDYLRQLETVDIHRGKPYSVIDRERYRRKTMDYYKERIRDWIDKSASWTSMDDIDYHEYYDDRYKSIVDQRMLHWLQQQLLHVDTNDTARCILLCELGQLLCQASSKRSDSIQTDLALRCLCSILDLPLRLHYARAYVLLANKLLYSYHADEIVLLHLAAMHGYSTALVQLYSDYARLMNDYAHQNTIAVGVRAILEDPSHALVKPLGNTPLVNAIQGLGSIVLPNSTDQAIRMWLIPVLTRGMGISRVEDLRYRIGTLLDVIREHQDQEHYRRLLDRQFDLSCDLRLIVLQYLSSD